MANTKETPTPGKLEAKFTAFLGARKRLLIIIAAAIVVVVLGLWIGLTIANRNADAAQLEIDNLQRSYSEWVFVEDKGDPEAVEAKENLVEELTELSHKGGASYPVLKATYLLGLIAYEDGSYQESLERFETVSEKGRETYLGSLSLYNAGVASEQLGDRAKALEYYQSVYDTYGAEATEAPKALFSVARLHEANNDMELAKAVFQQLADEFATSEYAKLARSRLIILQ